MLTFSVNPDISKVVLRGTMAEARPTTDLGRQWWSDVWLNTLEGRTEGVVNIDAYAYTCQKNTMMSISQNQVALLTADELQSGLRHGVADTVAFHVDATVDDVLDRAEVKTLVQEFIDLHEYLLIEEGVNIWTLMKLILEGDASLSKLLAEILDKYKATDLYIRFFKNNGAYAATKEVLA